MASRAERAMSFGAIADDYDRLRPSPADAAVDWLLPRDCKVAVDLGAGTGLLSRALARRAGRVVAVEPDERMRAVLRARSPGVEVIAGRGEAIPLPDASADAVLASSSWHWMDPGLAVPEVTRVLRDGGRFGLIWTSRDREANWLRDLGERPPGPAAAEDDGQPAARAGLRTRDVTLPHSAAMRDIATRSFRFTRRMAIADLTDMLATYSRVITASPDERAAELARARAALEQLFPGATQIDVPMLSWCWRADRTDRRPGQRT